MTNKSQLMGWPHYEELIIPLFKRKDEIKDLLELISYLVNKPAL